MAKSFYTTGTGNEQTLTPIINEKVPIYDTVADAESDLSNLEVGQIVKTKDVGLVANLNPIDEVKQGVFLPPTSNAVAKSLSYSTTEEKTGGKWIDGKPIYRKVYDNLNITTDTTNWVTLGIQAPSNLGTLVTKTLIGSDTGSQYTNMPAILSGCIFAKNNVNGNFDVVTVGNRFVVKTVIIEYTKTTD